jgi:hypothetical protein
MTYRPLQFFAFFGVLSFLTGLIISLRFVYFYLAGTGTGHVQSLLLSILLMGTGFFLVVMALVADLISVNRKLMENVRWRLFKLEEYLREVYGYEKPNNGEVTSSHISTNSNTVHSGKRRHKGKSSVI